MSEAEPKNLNDSLDRAKLAFLERTLSLPIQNLGFSDFARELLIALSEVIPCAAGSLLELDQQGGTLFFRATLGQKADNLSEIRVPSDRGIVGHVIQTAKPYLAEDLEISPFHLKSVERVVDYQGRNMIAAPVVVRGRIYGVVELLDRLMEPTFTPRDLELLGVLCNYMGVVLETRLVLSYALQSQAPHLGG
jgi:GAF domain-containing protein